MALNSYRIIRTIHHSRRYLLYEAESMADKRRVLIKTQDPAQLRDTGLSQSLESEAAAGAQLVHPAIRKGIGYFTEGLSGYLVAEYAAGSSLADLLLNNPEVFTRDQCLLWARDILHALHYAHSRGHHHKNLNPYNIIIDDSKGLKIIGFGKSGREAWRHSEGNMNYPYPMLYVAPEIFQTSNPHPNSDLYSWAVILYQMLCRKLPWRLDGFSGPDEQKMQSLSRGVTMPDVEQVPDWLYGILISCLKSDPDERCKDSFELLEILSEQSVDFDWTYQEAELPEPEPESEEYLLTDAQSPADEDQTEQMEADLPGEPEREKEGEEKPAEEVEPIPKEAEEVPILEDSIKEESAGKTELTEAAETVDEEIPQDAQSPADVVSEEQPEEDLPDQPEIEQDKEEEPRVEAELTPKEPEEAPRSEESIEDKIKEDEAQPADITIRIPMEDKADEQKEIKTMKKVFIALFIISVIFLGYLLVDNYFLQRKPELELSSEEPEIDLQEITEPILAENIPIEMIWVPADTLIMGSISPEADDDEFPLLTVPLRGFMISSTELTQSQWGMVNESNPSLFKGADLPVENVSFYDAIEFCNAKSLKDGLKPAYDFQGNDIICDFDANGYRLPTEAEWEFAAKAGIGKNFMLYSGSDEPDLVGWYAGNSRARSHAVGEKEPNELGIYDMSGNVCEWVWNWYAPYSYRMGNLYSGPQDGTDKVIRGGSWYYKADLMRSTARDYMKPFAKTGYVGFRVVRSR